MVPPFRGEQQQIPRQKRLGMTNIYRSIARVRHQHFFGMFSEIGNEPAEQERSCNRS
jgi:hypothetical protein